MVVGEYGIQTFESGGDCVVAFDVFVSTCAHPLVLFGQMVCPNILIWVCIP
jgi:hypothetical protein